MYKVRALSDWKFSVMFLSLRFYVKTILGLVTVQKMLFWQILEALNFHCDGYFHILRVDFSKNQNSEPQKTKKKHIFNFLELPELISRKIWVTGKSWNFHTVKSLCSKLVLALIAVEFYVSILARFKLGGKVLHITK